MPILHSRPSKSDRTKNNATTRRDFLCFRNSSETKKMTISVRKLKGHSGRKFFSSIFSQKFFDRSEDQLHQVLAFYNLPFLRHNRLDFLGIFPLGIFIRVANQKQNFKKLLHGLDFPYIFCGRGIVKQSEGLEL